MKQPLLFKLTIVCIFFFTVAVAQESGPIQSFDVFQTESTDHALVKRIQSLAFDNISSLYFEGDKIVSRGDVHAKRFICSVNRLSDLEKTKSSFKDVELLFLTIRNAEDLRLLEASGLNEVAIFSNLKYLFISVEYNIANSELRNTLNTISLNSGILSFYQINVAN